MWRLGPTMTRLAERYPTVAAMPRAALQALAEGEASQGDAALDKTLATLPDIQALYEEQAYLDAQVHAAAGTSAY